MRPIDVVVVDVVVLTGDSDLKIAEQSAAHAASLGKVHPAE